jgi:hypothetical protein
VRPSRELLGAVVAVFDDDVNEEAAADVVTLLADGDLVLESRASSTASRRARSHRSPSVSRTA